jgi:hypothetical protein
LEQPSSDRAESGGIAREYIRKLPGKQRQQSKLGIEINQGKQGTGKITEPTEKNWDNWEQGQLGNTGAAENEID